MDGVKVRDDSVPADLLEAMWTRRLVRWIDADTVDQQINEYIDWEDQRAHKEFQRMKDLYNKGEAYFRQGYRLRSDDRSIAAVPHMVPENALAWAVISAGHIATSEAHRLIWAYKKAID